MQTAQNSTTQSNLGGSEAPLRPLTREDMDRLRVRQNTPGTPEWWLARDRRAETARLGGNER